MNREFQTKNLSKKIKSLSEEIKATIEKLQKPQARQEEKQRKDREKNQNAVIELIKAEQLDRVTSNIWREMRPRIKALLVAENVQR